VGIVWRGAGKTPKVPAWGSGGERKKEKLLESPAIRDEGGEGIWSLARSRVKWGKISHVVERRA